MTNGSVVSANGPEPSARLVRIGYGAVLTIEVLLMLAAGSSKFTAPRHWLEAFTAFGYPPAMAYVVGVLEMIGALLLLVPRLTAWAATGLGVIMIGALFSVLTHPNDLGWHAPLIHLALLGVLAFGRWGRRWGAKMG
jgi:uncharacterized membrane protein YphA (DoxX/SURF4 family)